MNGLIAHTLRRPPGLIEADVVLDVGAGIRPMQWYTPRRHICVEPHKTYWERLLAAGYECVKATAYDVLYNAKPGEFDAIYLLDVIEHMERAEGEAVLAAIEKAQPQQSVVFTPDGFVAQEGDAWGLDGAEWQRHRSGWTASDFPGWAITKHGKGIFAVWTRH